MKLISKSANKKYLHNHIHYNALKQLQYRLPRCPENGELYIWQVICKKNFQLHNEERE